MQDDTTSNTGPAGTSEPSFYHEEDGQLDASPQFASTEEVNWTASEFIAHHKGALWYVFLAMATLLFAVLAYVISRDRLTVAAIIMVAVCFGFFASRPPRTLQYVINAHGITIGDKIYPYSILRAFSIQHEGALNSIVLMPLKRFMPVISVYYPPDQEEEIIKTLSSYLPLEQRNPDPIDRLMRHIRF